MRSAVEGRSTRKPGGGGWKCQPKLNRVKCKRLRRAIEGASFLEGCDTRIEWVTMRELGNHHWP